MAQHDQDEERNAAHGLEQGEQGPADGGKRVHGAGSTSVCGVGTPIG